MGLREDLGHYFNSCKPAEFSLEVAAYMKQEFIPKKLYKYRVVNKNSLSNLRNNMVWCNRSDQFNDPYDSAICFSFSDEFFFNSLLRSLINKSKGGKGNFTLKELYELSESEATIKSIIDLVGDKYEKKMSIPMKERVLSAFQSGIKNEVALMNNELNRTARRALKICSFSERFDSVLMWSHYCDEHKGFVIQYDFSTLPVGHPTSNALWPVIYNEKIFDASKFFGHANHSQGWVVIPSLCKAEDWRYESEWRLVFLNGPKEKPFPYAVPTPTAIFLGSRMANEHKENLIRIARRKNIDVFSMSLAHDEFKMIPVQIDTNKDKRSK